MDDVLSEQLLDLRNALVEAVSNSKRVAKAMALLRESGRDVQIAIDAMLVNGEPKKQGTPGLTDSTNAELFGPLDRMFLHTLKISGE